MQDRRIETVAVPDHELNARAPHRLDHGPAFLDPDRDRLFDQHMLAARGSGDDVRGVHLMGCRDIDRIDRWIVAQRLDGVVGRRAEIRLEPPAGLRPQIGRGDQRDPRIGREGRQHQRERAAEPCNSETDGANGHSVKPRSCPRMRASRDIGSGSLPSR